MSNAEKTSETVDYGLPPHYHFVRQNSAIDIASHVKQHGIAVIPSFLEQDEIHELLEAFKYLESDESQQTLDCSNEHQKMLITHIEGLAPVVAETNYIRGQVDYLEPEFIMNKFSRDSWFLEVTNRYFMGKPHIMPIRWQTLETWSSPKKSVQTPYYLHFDKQHFLKFYFCLTDTTVENGAMQIQLDPDYPSTARIQRTSQRFSGKNWGDIDNQVKTNNGPIHSLCYPAGSLLIFDSNMPHRQGRLSGSSSRKVMIIEAQSHYEAKYVAQDSNYPLFGSKS
jgi:hypothetical protein